MADVYVAGSLRHTPREWWAIYERIAKIIETIGMSAYVPHIHTPNEVGAKALDIDNLDMDGNLRAEIYRKQWKVIENAKLVIAEITQPSTGTGIEIGLALKLNKPVICMAHKTANITSMVMGPAHLGMVDVIRYDNEEDGMAQLKRLLENKYKSLLHQ
ncbi:MAG: nucleoside 2-deoxyribosyltransferase [Candidatus Aenigmarchaeota archaeon]|nr:nucleoside 2-deoxyribosyltransferase [Candidatus Aenigmarchaeota archaeon]